MPLSQRSAVLFWFLAASLQMGVGCDQNGSPPPEKSEALGEVVAVDSEGRPWRQGPQIKLQWPDDPRLDIAREFLRNHQYVQAEVILRTVLGENASIGRARMLLGITVQKQKRYAAALELLDEAIATGQPFPEAAHGEHFRGWCLYHLGHPKEAQTAFKAHVQAFPNEGDSHFGIGLIDLEAAQWDAAEARFNTAIDLQRGRTDRIDGVAKATARIAEVVQQRDGDLARAEALLAEALSLQSDLYEAGFRRARLLRRLDRHDEADVVEAAAVAARDGQGANRP